MINQLLTNDLTNIYSEIGKIWLNFVKDLYLQCEKVGISWVEINVLWIVDQDHQWWVIAVENTNKLKPFSW